MSNHKTIYFIKVGQHAGENNKQLVNHPKLIDSSPMMKDRTLDWALSNSLPVGFIAFSGLKGFPL